jgi:wyosine [tRNA(Phe)-imidazoG37] synthetase (radical SAM superfamily)
MELQTSAVYGVQSRRFGRSLGVNLAPPSVKACNFNCAYCEYGRTGSSLPLDWPAAMHVVRALELALVERPKLDAIIIAGNGEPTLHPAFARIVDGLLEVRARRAPETKLVALSNGSTLNRLEVVRALTLLDERHMKLDAGDATTLLRVNACPISLGRLIADLRDLGDIVVQSRFVRDARRFVDNTTPSAVSAWVEALRTIQPRTVHICSLDRTPARRPLLKIDHAELEAIAARVMKIGIRAEVLH